MANLHPPSKNSYYKIQLSVGCKQGLLADGIEKTTNTGLKVEETVREYLRGASNFEVQ